ncbi:MAG: hypothetical protein JWN51_2588 [Phycisphaerales bacterium]|nr:hypothetical protein [Phycisphaerales bacterium]
MFGLLPWGAVSLWLLWGRRRKTGVPFLELWRGPALQRPAKSALQPPAVSLALAMGAMLLAVVAAGGPRAAMPGSKGRDPVAIVVDRGMSMSATSGGVPRFRRLVQARAKEISAALGATTPVDWVDVPGGEVRRSNAGNWAGAAERLAPTAIDTQETLRQAVRDRLATTSGPVIVLSDRPLGIDDPRLVQIAPESKVENVGIAALSAREMPSPQVMVRLRNDSGRTAAQVKVSSDGQGVGRSVDLPPRGGEQDYFFDLPALGKTVEASLLVAADDQPADDRAWLEREGSFPRIEPRSPVSGELRRMIDVYSKARPPTDSSQRVAIVNSGADLATDVPAVIVAPPGAERAKGTVFVADHPITRDVEWAAFPRDVLGAGEAPSGWTAVVSVGGRVIVAARSQPARQVWVGFDPGPWSATPDYVVFWANVFGWVGSGQERFVGYPLGAYEGGWKSAQNAPVAGGDATQWPGIFESPGGERRAFNALAQAISTGPDGAVDWRSRLAAAAGPGRAGVDVGPAVLLLAIGCLAGAALTWKRTGLTPVSAARTF